MFSLSSSNNPQNEPPEPKNLKRTGPPPLFSPLSKFSPLQKKGIRSAGLGKGRAGRLTGSPGRPVTGRRGETNEECGLVEGPGYCGSGYTGHQPYPEIRRVALQADREVGKEEEEGSLAHDIHPSSPSSVSRRC